MPGLQLFVKIELPPAPFTFQTVVKIVKHVEIAFASENVKANVNLI